MRTISVVQGQTVYDVALQHCGNQSAAIEVALLNGIDVTADLANGTTLQVPAVVDKRVVSYYTSNKIVSASLNSI